MNNMINNIPSNTELNRLAALAEYEILDTPAEAVYDVIARLAASN
jgi:hypothetical protein